MSIYRPCVASLVLLFVAACAPVVKTQVEAYSEIPADIEPKTVYIAPRDNTAAARLDWKANAEVLAGVLSAKGFSTVPERSKARLTAFFDYSVDQGEIVQTTYSTPEWGVTGYSSANTYGSVYGNSYSSTTTLTPTYGVTGYRQGTMTGTLFTRTVHIDMIDNTTGKQVFQVAGVSRGTCGSFSQVAAPIIAAVLTSFPEARSGYLQLPSSGC
ncbi:MAG: hypothetical protein KDK03_10995 [Rhodobacteraceae bacterium]|nr:hypothetical protein [Paracoccaceae bacterium]